MIAICSKYLCKIEIKTYMWLLTGLRFLDSKAKRVRIFPILVLNFT